MWTLLRATHFAPSVAVTTFATLLALAAGRGAGSALVAVAVLAGQFSIGWANDWLDAGRDRAAGRSDKPLATGALQVHTVRTAALLALAVCVPLSLASGPVAGLVHLLAVALGWAYDLRLKATPLSVLPYAGAFALLPVFVLLGLPQGTPGAWWVAVGGGLLGAGAHFVNALPDLGDDVRLGVLGLPQRLGARRSLLAAALLLGAGVGVVTLGPGGALGGVRAVGLVAGLGCVTGAIVAGLAGRERLAFPLAIATSGVVVVALLSQGPALA